nr:unnamed protein product [Callosobruchus analis]
MVKRRSQQDELKKTSFNGMGSGEKTIKKCRQSLGTVPLNPAKRKKRLEESIKSSKSISNEKVPQINKAKESQTDVSTSPMEKNNIKIEDIQNAIRGVIKYREADPKLKNQLFDERVPMFLQISLHKIPKGHPKLLRIALRNETLGPDDEICLIVPDVKGIKNSEHEKHVEHYESLLQSRGVTNIKKIMTFHELRTENETFEQRRRLVDLYDIFLVDGRISGKVVSTCGKIFYKKRKVPTAVKMYVSNLQDHIERALSKTIVNLHLKSASYSIEFGHTKMEFDKLVDNLIGVVDFLSTSFPGRFENIKSMHVFAPRSTSIPIYVSLESPGSLKVPTVKTNRPKAYKTYSGELTTRLDTTVIVRPTGEVMVRKIKDKSMGESPNNAKESVITEDVNLVTSKKHKKIKKCDEDQGTTELTADKNKSKKKKAKLEEAVAPSIIHEKKKHKKIKTSNDATEDVSADEFKRHEENEIGNGSPEMTEPTIDKKKHKKKKKAKPETAEVMDSSIYEHQAKKHKKKKAIHDEDLDTTEQSTAKEKSKSKKKRKSETDAYDETMQDSLEEQQPITGHIKPKKKRKAEITTDDTEGLDENIEQTYSQLKKPKKQMEPIQVGEWTIMEDDGENQPRIGKKKQRDAFKEIK